MSQEPNVFARRPVPHVRIAPSRGWQLIDVRELFAYRDLFLFLVLRDIKVLYKQTVLGFSWAIIRPLFQMILFTVIFGNLARVSSDGAPYAVFSYVALVPWNYFSTAVTTSANSLVVGANMLSKVYFPRMVMPLSPLLAKLVDFAIAFSIVFVLMAIYGIAPTANVVFLPLLLLIIMLTAGGAGLWLAALAVQYRDVKHVMEFLTQILMFAAPVVWPVTLIAERFGETARLAFGLYPMAGAIEGFRSALLGTNPMPWDMIGLGALSAIVLFVTGAFYFRRMERRFADVA
jgi:lipopolysaccharide transport system permease protein